MLSRKAHIPQEEVFLFGSDEPILSFERIVTPKDKASLRQELLQKELDLLRARLDIVRAQAGVVARSGLTWANASARSQLGPYPWLKFAALAASSFLVTNAVRKLPLGSITAVAVPLATAMMKRRMR